MKTLSLAVVLMGLTGVAGSALAQEPASPTPRPVLPSGPLLNKAEDFSSWTISNYRMPAGQRPLEIKSMAGKQPDILTTTTKTNEVRHYVTRHRVKKVLSGSQEEIWQQGPYIVTHESMWQGSQLSFEDTHEDTPFADFPEFSWIKADNFVGVQSVDGATCLVFDATITITEKKTEVGNEAIRESYRSGPATQTHERAYIDQDTRLPKILQNGDVISYYAFQAAPKEMLGLPAADQQMINEYIKQKAARLRPPQPP